MVDQIVFNDALLDGAKEVFESMIFMDIEESSGSSEQLQDQDAMLSSITFKGEFEGCFAICCGTNCVKTIATNMLGMEPDETISDEEACDALGEVANMVMGSIKSRVAESAGNIEVSIPSVVRGRQLKNSLGERSTRILVGVTIGDEYPAELSLLYREKTK